MFSLGIDVGGTFTDCIAVDENGAVATVAKTPTDRTSIDNGVMAALAVAATNLSMTLPDFLDHVRTVVHGSTVATNAVVERRGARTGLLTTAGHEDAILIGKVIQKVAGLSEREMTNQAGLRKPDPLIPRALIRGVVERVDRDGDVVVPLYETQAAHAVAELVALGVEALAVSLLWSFVNPKHERRVVELCKADYPRLYLVSSHEIAPLLGEYERTATTALSAYVGPAVTAYLRRLERRLQSAGCRATLLLAHAAGGVTSVNDVARHPLLTLDSGPASGVVGAQHFGRANDAPNVICADMGGTTLDVSVIRAGRYLFDEEPVISQYHYLVPKIRVNSIGAGGGSVVWCEDGLVKVGPRSAGADPGPACYGKGGMQATVTDVDVFLGFLNPRALVGGAHPLHAELAEQALRTVGEGVEASAVTTACAAFAIVNAQMADLISKVTVESGQDPRDFVLFAYGGAAGCHVAYLARELKIRRVLISPHASVFSAFGMLCGGLKHSAERTFRTAFPLGDAVARSLLGIVGELRQEVGDVFATEGVGQDDQHYVASVYVKYAAQPKAIPVELAGWSADRDPAGDFLTAQFEQAYTALYGQGAGYPAAGFELVKCTVTGSAPRLVDQVQAPSPRVTGHDRAAARRRAVLFPEVGEFASCPVLGGDELLPGTVIAGPCIVERMGDTIVIPAFATAEVDLLGNVILDVRWSAAAGRGVRHAR